MAANVETMFSTREIPWHKMGIVLEDYPSYEDAIIDRQFVILFRM